MLFGRETASGEAFVGLPHRLQFERVMVVSQADAGAPVGLDGLLQERSQKHLWQRGAHNTQEDGAASAGLRRRSPAPAIRGVRRPCTLAARPLRGVSAVNPGLLAPSRFSFFPCRRADTKPVLSIFFRVAASRMCGSKATCLRQFQDGPAMPRGER